MDISEIKKLILDVEARSASELIKHKRGPGMRYVFSDHNNNPGGNIYTIVRLVENVDNPELHAEPHSHKYESLLIFKGNNHDLTGLEGEVLLDNKWHPVKSPQAVRIPPGLKHNYRFVKGSGEYWNIVLAPGANYNETIT